MVQSTADEFTAYWSKQLAGAPRLLDLPTDRPRRADQPFHQRTCSFTLDADLGRRLIALSASQGTAVFDVLLAGFEVLLARYCGTGDIVVSGAVPGFSPRPSAAAPLLPLRVDLSDDPPFTALLGRVATVARDAVSNSGASARWDGRGPDEVVHRTQVAFAYEPGTREHEDPALAPSSRTALQPDISLVVTAQPGLGGTIHYNAALFAPDTIERMAGHYRVLLNAAVSDPDQQISRLPLLTDQERHQILVEWNATITPPAPAGCVHELVERQAARTPDAVAVVHGDERLTFRQLDQRANQLAHHLRGHGVRPETVVGLCVERGLEMIIAVLGVLKAGGAYLPLDPDQPSNRLAFVLNDASVDLVLTQERLATSLPDRVTRVIIDRLDLSSHPAEACSSEATPETLAYVIYTSGSTGRPKGVMVEHRSVVNLIDPLIQLYGLDSTSRALMFASLTFDSSVSEILMPLCCGGVLIVPDKAALRPGPDLEALLRESGTTAVTLPPSALAMLNPDNLPGLEQVIVGGEACPPDVAAAWIPGRRMFNAYGPTEATDTTTVAEYSTRVLPPSIGRPVPNAQVYVLDPARNPVPVGVPGELYIAGAGLARGYLNRPGLTGQRFVVNPFGTGRNARMYRTGDRARWRPDGQLEYLGRVDHQIKIRGYRIEPGEIEAALCTHPSVRNAVVVVREDLPGEKRLVAYAASPRGERPSTTELRAHLRNSLPEFMVPSAFVFLDELPLTPNGKIDRAALPVPDRARPAIEQDYRPPRTQAETTLAKIWSEVLGTDRIGIHDNFFELGGDSLSAARVVARVRQVFEAEVLVADVFDRPRLAALAAHVEGQDRTALAPLRGAADGRPSAGQERLYFLHELYGANPAYHIGIGWRISGELDHAALRRSLVEITRRHHALRTLMVKDGAGVLINRIDPPDAPMRTIDLTDRPDDLDAVVAEMWASPFDLSQGPLLRFLLARLGQDEHVLTMIVHHMVFDEWSASVFAEELGILYAGGGRSGALPEPAVQYPDFAGWQRRRLDAGALEHDLAYWKATLTGVPALLDLPTDRPRPAIPSSSGSRVRWWLGADLTARLTALAQERGATLFMTLLAAFDVLLTRYTRQHDIVVGVPNSSRNRPELERLIGYFVNTLALRVDLSGDPTFTELLDRVKQTAVEASAHQDAPFDLVVTAVQPERSLAYTPVVQVMFAFNNTPVPALELDGLRVRPIQHLDSAAQFDLTLEVDEFDNAMQAAFVYRTELFDAATVERMAGHFRALLDAVVADPDRPISQLPLLTGTDRDELVVGWNATTRRGLADSCLHELVERQALRTPAAVAVECGGERVTYAQLDHRADQLARGLRAQGVGPDVIVGLCVERGVDLVVGMLGILKAGGAYLPLDPDHPAQRVAFVLHDAEVKLVVTQERLAGSLPGGVRAVVLDRLEPPEGEVERGSARTTPDALAYVIYTSGSTGRPKGVMIEHRSITNLVSGLTEDLGLRSDDRLLAVTTVAFDIAALELFGPLSCGGTVVIAEREAVTDGERLAQLLARSGATVMQATPSLWRMLLDSGWAGHDRLRALCGGEPLAPDLLDRLLPVVGSVWNLYGPTETTVWSLAAELDPAASERRAVPIGRPIANTRVYVLDQALDPVPVGLPGELHISGAGLARGYLNRPELTADRFIRDPFDGRPGSRMYRTGDVVRWRPDGQLEFLGRVDHQVKIRGHRVEPGEVEAALAAHPGVRDAVVVAREDSPGDKRLVAYLRCEDGAHPASGELREHLRERLPDYMLPSAFVALDHLPTTPNGKLDRNALPAPDSTRPALDRDYQPPRTPDEIALTAVWSDVLGVDRVGIDDDFFELGGDSLRALRTTARASELLEVRIPVRMIFRHPTIAALGSALDSLRQALSSSPADPEGDPVRQEIQR